MKKVGKIIIVIVCIAVVAGLGYVIPRMMKRYPEAVLSEEVKFCTEDGMYYAKNNRLYFFDAETETEVIVCNKANCKHDTTDCNAYTIDIQPYLLCYNDNIYISEGMVNFTSNEEGEDVYEAEIRLRELKQDGSGGRTIYSADNGSVCDLRMINGVLYFTAWTYHNGYQVNEYQHDWKLYAYDLRWNRLKVIKSYEADEEHDNSGLTLMQCDRDDVLYASYSYFDSEENETIEMLMYDIENDTWRTLKEDDEAVVNMIQVDDTVYLMRNEIVDNVEWQVIYKCDAELQNEEEWMRIADSRIDFLNGYMYIFNSDYNKFLYEYATGDFYFAHNAFTNEGTYVPDVYDIDAERNRIFINATDFTGYKPGDFLPGDMTDVAVADWDTFLSENFVKLTEENEAEIKAFDWLQLSEQE